MVRGVFLMRMCLSCDMGKLLRKLPKQISSKVKE